MTEKIVWDINDLSNALGRTQGSIRADLHRENWLRTPPPTRLAGTLVWRPQDVNAWLEERARESGAVVELVSGQSDESTPRRRRGRPTNAEKVRRQKQGIAGGN